MQLNQFDARAIAPAEAFQPVPAGEYKVAIISSEGQANSKVETGGHLKLVLRVLEGQFMNRELWYNLNLWNSNPQSAEIAQRQLSAICHVTGVFVLNDTAQLHNIPFVAIVAVQANGQYNDVKGVKDLQGNQPGKPNSNPVAAAAPPAFGAPPVAVAPQGASAPWGTPQAAPPPPAAGGWGPPAAAAPAQPAQPSFGQPQPSFAPPAAAAAPMGAPPWAAK
jgi:hypothetical protein